MDDYDNGGVGWVQRKGKRRYPRNIVIYADKPNRFTGELNCVHMELRFFNAASLKRNGIRSVSDLMAINPNILFQKHVKWSDAGDNYVINAMRKAVTADRQRQLPHHHPYTDVYRAHIPEKVKSILHRNGSDRAQNIVMRKRLKRNDVVAPFDIPVKRGMRSMPNEGALKTLKKSKKGVHVCVLTQ